MSESPPEPTGRPFEDLYEVLDRKSLKMLIEISGGDSAFLEKLFASFLSQCDQALPEFTRHLDAADSPSLTDLAHKIRGAATQLGASGLAAICGELEDLSKSERFEECVGSIDRLSTEYARVRDSIERFRQRSTEGS